MIKVVIFDFESKHIAALKNLIVDFCPEIQIIGEFTDLEKAPKLIAKLNPDFIFIDVGFLKKGFIDLIQSFSRKNNDFVFVATDDKYATTAIQNGAIDYLIKPFKKEDILRVADKFIRKKINDKIVEQFSLFKAQIKELKNVNINLAVPTIDGFLFFELDEIIRLEAKGSYTNIYTSNKGKVVSSKNIKEYEMHLPKDLFFRVHNSHIVNIKRLEKYEKGRGGILTMQDGSKILLSSRRKIDFLNMFK